VLTKSAAATDGAPAGGDARERILAAAYELFSRDGLRAVGIEAIIARSGVARMTLYRHFASKEALVLAFMERRELRWTREWLQADVERRATDPAERLLAIFDVFDGWFRRDDFEGCTFVKVVQEVPDPADPVNRAGVAHLENIRDFLRGLARGARVADPDDFARKWHILMKGSIVSAGEGDVDAARRAQDVGRLLLAQELPAASAL
jgi:AcrR family transcriptional regulator